MYIVFILIIYIIILYLNELEFGLVKLNELGLELEVELIKRLVKKLVKLNEPSPSFKNLNELELEPKYQAR